MRLTSLLSTFHSTSHGLKENRCRELKSRSKTKEKRTKTYHDEDDYLIDGVGFADPGGRSALRRATKRNPRNLPCPECGQPNRLTPKDRAQGYCCDECADRREGFEY
jgi:hypothetical protein